MMTARKKASPVIPVDRPCMPPRIWDTHEPMSASISYDAYGKMMPDYLRQSMQVFVAERDRMQNALDEMFTYNSKTMTQLGENLAKQNMEFFNRAMDFFQSMSGISRNAQNHGDEGNKSDAKERKLKDIQEQIEALQAELKSLK